MVGNICNEFQVIDASLCGHPCIVPFCWQLVSVPALVHTELVFVCFCRQLADLNILQLDSIDVFVVGILFHDEVVVPVKPRDVTHDTINAIANLKVLKLHMTLRHTLDVESHTYFLTSIL